MSKPRPRPIKLASHALRLILDYERISDDDKGDAGGVDRQHDLLQGLPLADNERFVKFFRDNNITAADPRVIRPDFEGILKAVEAGEGNVIRCVHFDRLFRQHEDLQRLVDLAQRFGLILTSIQSGTNVDLTNPSEVMRLEMLCSVAKHEVARGTQRLYSEQEARALKGLPASGQRCFGYLEGTKIVAAEARVIKEGTRGVMRARSLSSLAAEWNAAGVFPVSCGGCGHADIRHHPDLGPCKGKLKKPLITDCTCQQFEPVLWSATTVRQVLLRPRNAGLRQHRGEVVGEGKWDAIVSVEELEAVTAVLTARTKAAGHNSRKHLLSGILLCGNQACQRPMRVTSTNGVPYYACKPAGGRGKTNRAPGRHTAVEVEEADEFVHAFVVEYFQKYKATPEAEENPRIAEIREHIAVFKQRLADNDMKLMTDPTFDEKRGERIAQGLATSISNLQEELAGLIRLPSAAGVMDDLQPEHVQSTWDALSLDQKRNVLSERFVINSLPAGGGLVPGRVRIAVSLLEVAA